MSNEIRIQKTTFLMVLGLLLAVAAGAYVINTTTPPAEGDQDTAAGLGSAPETPQQLQAAPAAQQAAPRKGGCGCGGGGTSCGAGTQALAPDPSKAILLNTTGTTAQGDFQEVYIKAEKDGTYDKQEVTVRAGSPVRLHFTADPDAGCGRQMVIYGMNIKAVSSNGEEDVVEFIPQKAGTYEYSCGMRMWGPGKLVVV